MGDSTTIRFRHIAGRYALGAVIFGAGLFLYVATEFSHERRKEAAVLQIIIGVALTCGFLLGLVGLPKLESFVALFIFTITSLFFLRTVMP